MNKFSIFITLAAAGIGLSACGDGTGTARYMIDPPDSAQRTGDQLGAAELKEVSLPDYAAADEIAWQGADGHPPGAAQHRGGNKPHNEPREKPAPQR